MSYDFAVWFPHRAFSNKEAGEIYSSLSEKTQRLEPHPSIATFYNELTALHPELGDAEAELGDLDRCPWSVAHERTDRYMVMCCSHSRAQMVWNVIGPLAERNGLAIYDPQEAKLFLPSTFKRKWWQVW